MRQYLLLLAAIATGIPALADNITTFQLTSTDTAGEAVSAKAVFDLNVSSNTLTVYLYNLTSNQVSAGQAISGIKFGLSSGSATYGGATGDLIDLSQGGFVNSSDTLTAGNQPVSSSLNLWSASTSLSNVTLSDLGTGQPKQTILGLPTSGQTTYSSANGSITGGSHNPLTWEVATYVFTGVTGAVNAGVGAVQIGFGTAGTNYISTGAGTTQIGANPYDTTSTPEPATWSMMLLGGGLILLGARRRVRR